MALTKKQEIANKVIWFTSVGRNAAVVIGCTIVAYVMDLHGTIPFILTGFYNLVYRLYYSTNS